MFNSEGLRWNRVQRTVGKDWSEASYHTVLKQKKKPDFSKLKFLNHEQSLRSLVSTVRGKARCGTAQLFPVWLRADVPFEISLTRYFFSHFTQLIYFMQLINIHAGMPLLSLLAVSWQGFLFFPPLPSKRERDEVDFEVQYAARRITSCWHKEDSSKESKYNVLIFRQSSESRLAI